MVNSMNKYGYNSRAAFLRDPNPREGIMRQIVAEDDWFFVKGVLKHPKCPIDIRDKYAADPIWYKRIVAFFATKAPSGYVHKAANDPDKRIQRAYQRYISDPGPGSIEGDL
jgi:hypothetical protein